MNKPDFDTITGMVYLYRRYQKWAAKNSNGTSFEGFVNWLEYQEGFQPDYPKWWGK